MSEAANCSHDPDGFCSVFCRAHARSAEGSPVDVPPETPAEAAAPPPVDETLRELLLRVDALEAQMAEEKRDASRAWGPAVLSGKKSS